MERGLVWAVACMHGRWFDLKADLSFELYIYFQFLKFMIKDIFHFCNYFYQCELFYCVLHSSSAAVLRNIFLNFIIKDIFHFCNSFHQCELFYCVKHSSSAAGLREIIFNHTQSEDQCVLLRARFGRCSDLKTFGTDTKEDFISRTSGRILSVEPLWLFNIDRANFASV